MSAQEVRVVLDHARQYSGREWASFFQVHPQTIKTWRQNGMRLDIWSGPTGEQWRAVKAEASRCLWEFVSLLDSQ